MTRSASPCMDRGGDGGDAAAEPVRVGQGDGDRVQRRIVRGGGVDEVAEDGPASTEASWPGSPTRTRRASGRRASSRRAIIVKDTMLVSSITTRSCGSRFVRSWRKRLA